MCNAAICDWRRKKKPVIKMANGKSCRLVKSHTERRTTTPLTSDDLYRRKMGTIFFPPCRDCITVHQAPNGSLCRQIRKGKKKKLEKEMQGEKTLWEMFPFAAQMISCKLKNKIGTEVIAPL